jgi:hypothetical protein
MCMLTCMPDFLWGAHRNQERKQTEQSLQIRITILYFRILKCLASSLLLKLVIHLLLLVGDQKYGTEVASNDRVSIPSCVKILPALKVRTFVHAFSMAISWACFLSFTKELGWYKYLFFGIFAFYKINKSKFVLLVHLWYWQYSNE